MGDQTIGILMYGYRIEYIEGFLHYERRFLKPIELTSRYGDGACEEGNPYKRPVLTKKIRKLLRPFGGDLKIRILGTELDALFRIMLPGLDMVLPKWAKKEWARRFGWSLWVYGHKGTL